MSETEKLNEIISGCKQGNNEAFSKLIDLYSDRCYGYFYRLTGDANIANDLLSDLFLRLVERISSFKGSSFNNWIFTVASNIFRDYLRQKYRRQKLINGKIEELQHKTTARQPDNKLADKLQENIARLDADSAELIMLRYYGQLSFKELAEVRKVPVGTVLSKVHRSIKRLKELMGNENE
ncbi:MAG: RNA polymerase sigma factor [Planctomycetes bacterium]|nr:RNA polymerase sigma factor [Planctomycetota bacterium]